MEQSGKRRQFDAAFKAEAVHMVTSGGYTQAQAARQLGIEAKRISHWIKQMQQHGTAERAFPGQGHESGPRARCRTGSPPPRECHFAYGTRPFKKSGFDLRRASKGSKAMRFTFIQKHRGHWPLRFQCRVLGVTRHGYCVWRTRQRQPSARQQQDARLLLQIKAAHRRGRGTYGSPRVFQVLRDQGVRVSRKRIARLMREAGLKGVWRGRRKPRTTNPNHRLPVANNLLERRFSPQDVGGLNQVWCGDITYVATTEGWLYLATVQDLFSRRIVGWSLAESLEAELVCDAFERAAKARGFACQVGAGQLFHSDRGSQYASDLFGKTLKKHGFVPSMSRKANCWDNAVAESFFGTYKSELVAEQPGGQFANKEQAYRLTADYIENFYNRVRLHSTLDYRSPVMFELAHQAGQLSAF